MCGVDNDSSAWIRIWLDFRPVQYSKIERFRHIWLIFLVRVKEQNLILCPLCGDWKLREPQQRVHNLSLTTILCLEFRRPSRMSGVVHKKERNVRFPTAGLEPAESGAKRVQLTRV